LNVVYYFTNFYLNDLKFFYTLEPMSDFILILNYFAVECAINFIFAMIVSN